jgi:hypothetical protein
LFESCFKSFKPPSYFPLSILFLGRNQKKRRREDWKPGGTFYFPSSSSFFLHRSPSTPLAVFLLCTDKHPALHVPHLKDGTSIDPLPSSLKPARCLPCNPSATPHRCHSLFLVALLLSPVACKSPASSSVVGSGHPRHPSSSPTSSAAPWWARDPPRPLLRLPLLPRCSTGVDHHYPSQVLAADPLRWLPAPRATGNWFPAATRFDCAHSGILVRPPPSFSCSPAGHHGSHILEEQRQVQCNLLCNKFSTVSQLVRSIPSICMSWGQISASGINANLFHLFMVQIRRTPSFSVRPSVGLNQAPFISVSSG